MSASTDDLLARAYRALQGKAARRTLGGLKSAIWQAAKKCAEKLP